jgi:YbbR domain-containing protein
MKKTVRGNNTANVKIVISIIIAFVLWIYVVSDQDPTNSQRYNNLVVKAENVQVLEEKGLVVSGIQELPIDVTLRGRTSVLYNLAWRNLTAVVDLSGIEEKGTYDLPVSIRGIPDTVELNKINPTTIQVEIDRMTQQNREIQIDFTGEVPQGFQLTDHTINPNTVILEGGENLLATIQKVGGTLDLSDKKEGFSEVVTLKAYDERGVEVTGITMEPAEVTVTAAIGNHYLLPVEVVMTGEPEEGFVIKEVIVTPKEVAILSQGPTQVTQIKTEPINIEGIQESGEITAALIYPNGLTPVAEVGIVQVTIVVESIDAREFSVTTLEYRNRPEGLEVTGNQGEQSVVVRLSGPTSVVSALKQNQIQLYVDLKEAVLGDNLLVLNMDLLEGITLESLEPTRRSVTLKEVDP